MVGGSLSTTRLRFLSEVPDELVEWIREEPSWGGSSSAWNGSTDWSGGGWSSGSSSSWSGGKGTSSSWNASGSSSSYSATSHSAKQSGRLSGRRRPTAPVRNKNNADLHLEVGDKVNHDKYGLGTVKSVDGSSSTTVMIDFGSSGTVRLMLFGGVPMEKL